MHAIQQSPSFKGNQMEAPMFQVVLEPVNVRRCCC